MSDIQVLLRLPKLATNTFVIVTNESKPCIRGLSSIS